MPTPTELNLHRQSRVLEISFDDGSHFNFPCEFLRVYSPSAEVQGHGPGQGTLQVGKEDVNIDQIEPVGHYAICLHFDDEHNTGHLLLGIPLQPRQEPGGALAGVCRRPGTGRSQAQETVLTLGSPVRRQPRAWGAHRRSRRGPQSATAPGGRAPGPR